MMLDDEVEITLKDKNIAPLNLARLLRDIWQSELASPANCIYVAKCLINGETWRPTLGSIHIPNIDKSEHLNLVFPESEIDKDSRLRREQQTEYWELGRRGAAGDAEAAIAFCKLEMEGKISHGAFA